MSKLPWGHKSKRCCYCQQVGPRTQTIFGGYVAWAHKHCIPKEPKAAKRPTLGEKAVR